MICKEPAVKQPVANLLKSKASFLADYYLTIIFSFITYNWATSLIYSLLINMPIIFLNTLFTILFTSKLKPLFIYLINNSCICNIHNYM